MSGPYVAYYAPALIPGQEDPTKEFPTEEEALAYVYDGMCQCCQNERILWLAGDKENGSAYPACACEFFVIPKEEYERSSSFDDILTAAGYGEPIYTKPESSSGESEDG